MEPLPDSKSSANDQHRLQAYNLPILTFRKMLSSALQDLFGIAVGGGLAVDILSYSTPQELQLLETEKKNNNNNDNDSSSALLSHSVFSTLTSSSAAARTTSIAAPSSTTVAWAILRCSAHDLQSLWNALTLFNSTVDDFDVRIQVHRTSATLLALASSSRGYSWDQAPAFQSAQ
ncbi:hypothetical protein BGW42_007654 [Actinomortierella wolfii]|nr:hypothetical protein BGW42_007654 [Actinomortierella wolfii]